MSDEQTPGAPPDQPGSRSDDRDRRTWWILIAIGALIVLGIMLLLRPVIAGRLTAATQLDRAGTTVVQTTSDVDLIDRTVHADPSSQAASIVVDVQRKLPAAKTSLERAVAMVDAGFQHLTDDEQRRASLTRATAAARVKMLDAAGPILSAMLKADTAGPLAVDAWNRTVASSSAEKQAVTAYDLKTASGLKQAGALVAQSEDGFTAARGQFSAATAAFPAARLDAYSTFVDQRLRQLALLKAAIAARESGSTARADRLVASYDAEQAKSAALAKTLPAAPGQAIADAYRLTVAAQLAAFDKARADAVQADTDLKNL